VKKHAAEIERLVEEGYLFKRKHPDFDLFIYNYTPQTQYEQNWNEITMQCRGLVLDTDYNVVARPLSKFFNLGEHEEHEIPNEKFEVFDKLDGSLGLLFWYMGTPHMATRGSFESDQAKKGVELLKDYAWLRLSSDHTYWFEIIYPQNRIVVDYGKEEKLVLLGAVHTETGKEVSHDEITEQMGDGFEVVKRHDGIKDFRKLSEKEEENKEGFVIRFESGFRVKAKFEEYVRLHRIITGISNKVIWEHLKEGRPLDELIEKVPDEVYQYVKDTSKHLVDEFNDIKKEAKGIYRVVVSHLEIGYDRKSFALEATKHPKHAGILFAMLDGKDYEPIIWKMVRPTYETPFKVIE